NKKEIIGYLINLIWEATKEGVREIVFNNASCSATIFLTDGTKDIKNLNATGVALISEEIYQKIINDLANIKKKESITIENNLGSNRLSEVDIDAQTNKNDILNLEEDQGAKSSHINDYFKISKRKKKNEQRENDNNDFENNEKTNELLPDSQAVGADDQFLIYNINQHNNEHVNNNRLTKNVREVDESMPNN
ncbi:15485_t:CDS:2, partial [Racocetra persica]